ncbi:MAG TPA: hypothetical protein VK986_07860, partial [Tepidisphaeraceae bacterium]|nr:hypothetical protein [Tepidisphaeraceae bacterium]
GPRAFRIGWKTGEWETDVFLDGQKTSFTAAVRAGRQVTVTHRQSGGGVIVLKVEVRSEPR